MVKARRGGSCQRLAAWIPLALLVALPFLESCRPQAESEEEFQPKQRVDELGRVVLTATEQEAIDLETVRAAAGTLTTTSLRFGLVVARPEEDAVVVAPVTARLLKSLTSLGTAVSEGEALVVVEPLADTASRAGLEVERRQLQGELDAAQAQVEAKRAELERVSTLVSTGLATAADRAQAEAELRSQEARAESLLQANHELEPVTGGTVTIRAPVSGTVATLASNGGSLVEQGAVLARIVCFGPRWVDLAVPPNDPLGDGYRLRGLTSPWPAHLLSRGALAQADGTRRDRLETEPEAAPDLLPGATVAVDVLHQEPGVLVPSEAIVRRGAEDLVFVAVDEGRFAPRVVGVAARQGEQAAVRTGVEAGDRVVARGSASLLLELEAGRTAPPEERQ